MVQTKTKRFIISAFDSWRQIKFLLRSLFMHNNVQVVVCGEKDIETFVSKIDASHILAIEFRFLMESPPSLNVMHSLYSGSKNKKAWQNAI